MEYLKRKYNQCSIMSFQNRNGSHLIGIAFCPYDSFSDCDFIQASLD